MFCPFFPEPYLLGISTYLCDVGQDSLVLEKDDRVEKKGRKGREKKGRGGERRRENKGREEVGKEGKEGRSKWGSGGCYGKTFCLCGAFTG